MVDRLSTDFTTIWTAIMSQLRTETGLTEDTCFWFLPSRREPREVPTAPADIFVTVTPEGGSFDEALFHGGGINQLTVNTGFIVTVHRTWHLDEAYHDNLFLLTDDGIGDLIRVILHAMAGFDPLLPSTTAVREQIRPTGFQQPWRSEEQHMGGIDIHFELSFDVDLTEPGLPTAFPPFPDDLTGSSTTTPSP